MPQMDLHLEQIESILGYDKTPESDYTVFDFSTLSDFFRIHKRHVSKTLRYKLFD